MGSERERFCRKGENQGDRDTGLPSSVLGVGRPSGGCTRRRREGDGGTERLLILENRLREREIAGWDTAWRERRGICLNSFGPKRRRLLLFTGVLGLFYAVWARLNLGRAPSSHFIILHKILVENFKLF